MKQEAKRNTTHLSRYVPDLEPEALQAQLKIDHAPVRLSMNENVYGPSPKVAEAIQAWTGAHAHRYPDTRLTQLREALATYHGVDPDALVFTNGLDEMIQILPRTYIEPGDEVLVHTPTFPEYASQARVDGASIIEVPDKQLAVDWPGMKAAISERTKLIYLCNPNNPTGNMEPLDQIEAFLDQVPANILVVLDEAYFQYSGLAESQSGVSLFPDYPNLMIMRTFSKAYGLANIRCGYTVLHPQAAEIVDATRTPFNVSGLTEIAALAGFQDHDYLAEIVEANRQERELWLAFFEELGLTHYPSYTNFVMFEVDDATTLIRIFRQAGYMVSTHSFPNWIRLTIPEAGDGARLRTLMRQALS
ncbi:histidinol-phosphate transaminase [Fundicoccus sp. Sow4_F4]|uniref:histidinol-phosphate transaminase n=1 Tax=Fundicoccus sp. Sow4_F4 TaxID=3438783 RepID=UPI003F8EA50D